MSDTLHWRDLTASTTHRWWAPVLLAIVGAVLGVYAAANLNPVHRSQGTVLVGPLDSTVIRSTTLRASESLAAFYADLARREVVLVPVRDRLGLSTPLQDLRDSVSAVVPEQNPRVVTITVGGESEERAHAIAVAIIDELVALSPAPTGIAEPEFVTAQADALENTIQQAELDIDELQATLDGTTDVEQRTELERTLSLKQQSLNEARQTYVELMSLEPDSDAGGLTVLDEVASVTDEERVGPSTAAVLGGAAGAVLGLVVVWLLDRRRRVPLAAGEDHGSPKPTIATPPTVNLVVRPTAGVSNRRLPRASPRRTESRNGQQPGAQPRPAEPPPTEPKPSERPLPAKPLPAKPLPNKSLPNKPRPVKPRVQEPRPAQPRREPRRERTRRVPKR